MKNKRNSPLSHEKRTSRFLKPPPPDLEVIIKYLAKLPLEEVLVDVDHLKIVKESHKPLLDLYLEDNEKERLSEVHQLFRFKVLLTILKSLPKSFADFVLGDLKEVVKESFFDEVHLDPDLKQGIQAAFHRYNTYRRRQIFMRRIIELSESSDSINPLGARNEISVFEGLYLDDDGLIRVESGSLVSAVKNVEAARIRVCKNKNCRLIFWAGRIAKSGSTNNDQVCCSPKCSHAYRNQRLRARYANPSDDYAQRKLTANEKSKTKKKGN